MNPPIDREQIFNALRQIYDPELGVNIVELGLVYEVQIEEGHVTVRMTMTSPGCPMHEIITRAADYGIQALKGVKSVEIQLVWEPPWNPDMISAVARAEMA